MDGFKVHWFKGSNELNVFLRFLLEIGEQKGERK